jgi:hypothetical protein
MNVIATPSRLSRRQLTDAQTSNPTMMTADDPTRTSSGSSREPVADIVPHGRRARWLFGVHLREQLRDRAADPKLTHDLDDLAGRALDEL